MGLGIKNIYSFKGDVGYLSTHNVDKEIKSTYIFDREDYDKIKDYHWYTNYQGYCVTETRGVLRWLHRVIMNTPTGMDTDHIDLDITNNRKSNLRICTRSLNNSNHRSRCDNQYGIKGIEQPTKTKWRAVLRVNSLRYRSYMYNTKEEAIYARQVLEKIFYPNYPITQHININLSNNIKNNIKDSLYRKFNIKKGGC